MWMSSDHDSLIGFADDHYFPRYVVTDRDKQTEAIHEPSDQQE